MPDREETISDIQDILNRVPLWRIEKTLENALALLREQDGTANDPPFQRHDCGALIVYRGRDVCPNCGRKVKWDA